MGKGNVQRFAQAVGLDESACVALMGNLAVRILESLESAFRAMERDVAAVNHTGGGLRDELKDLRARLEPGIIDLCERTLRQL